MAKKKAKKKRVKTTEWAIGQSIARTKKEKLDDVQNALDIVGHAIGEPLAPKPTARNPLKTKRVRSLKKP
ncbi:MAG TPA: hypothetical protein VLX11_03115 [Candidatus Acidoferrales bacterium]|nr:hypothetical protein [Candidatus Acidoferrales bacterium]